MRGTSFPTCLLCPLIFPIRMIKDDRVKAVKKESILDLDDDDFADRLG
jgi:hypothetical protein